MVWLECSGSVVGYGVVVFVCCRDFSIGCWCGW